MLHVPVNENKTKDRQSKIQSEPESRNRSWGWAGYSSLDLGGEELSRSGKDRAQGWQPISLSPLSQGGILQRKCACGNSVGSSETCSECQSKQNEMVQTKLTISEPGDKYEQEADRVASQVLSMSDSELQEMPPSDENEAIQRKPLATTITPLIQRETMVGNESSTQITNSLESRLNSSQGSPLPDDVRSFMEPRFGADFSQVRIHTDAQSVQMNRELNAQAFTHKQDVYFGSGKAPAKDILMAHELTHVAQQAGGVQLQVKPEEKKMLQRQVIGSQKHESDVLSIGRDVLRFKLIEQSMPMIQLRPAPYIKKITVHLAPSQNADLEWEGMPPDEATGSDHFTVSTGKGYSDPGDPRGTCTRTCCGDPETQCAPPWNRPDKVGACCTYFGNNFWTGTPLEEHNGWKWWTPIQPFYSSRGIALHQHTEVTGQPIGHGCVRMDEENAKRIYDFSNGRRTNVTIDGRAAPVACEDVGGEGLSQQGKERAQGWQPISLSPLSQGGILQRKCTCDKSAGSSGICSECQSKQGEMVQTKLRISEPGDKYEREADWIAERVMQISDSQASLTQLQQDIAIQDLPSDYGQKLDRQSIEEEEVEETMFDDMDLEESEEDMEPDETGMPKRENESANLTTLQVSSVHIPREEGHPLKEDMRNFMESRFGYDFGKVRIHTNTASVKSAQKLNARAYTVGENIYFNEGQYTSNTYEGRKLLAHELTHVIQQSNSTSLSKRILQKQPSNSTKKSSKSSSAGSCPQGKQKEVVRNDCDTSEPEDKKRYITELNVSLSSQTVKVVWSDGTTNEWECSPNPKVTPTGKDVVGVKCSVRHTNQKKDGMAWFTGFESEGLRIGFHDSQRVGKGIHSHGCVRVPCDKAKIINKNSWSGKTAIKVVK